MKLRRRLLRKRTGFVSTIALGLLATAATHYLALAPELDGTVPSTTDDTVPIIDSDLPPPAVLSKEEKKPPKIGRSRSSITVDGIKRSYILHIPKSFSLEKKVPLIIVLHGGGGNAQSAEWDSVMSAQSEKDGFVVAYPNGFMRTWNAGRCCGGARFQDINDVEFVRQIILKLEHQLGVDPDRIYVTGLSNGGMLSYRIGSELGDMVAAIAPVEGCMYELESKSDIPVSVIAFHGMEDKIVKYNGGIGWVCGYQINATPVAPTIEYWIKRNHCDATPIREQTGKLIKELYSNGNNGTEVCLYSLTDGKHAWPGGRRAAVIFDKPRKYVSATEVMCEFFWAHPKQRVQAEAGRNSL